MAQKKDKPQENPARDKAKELVELFETLNWQHSVDTGEEHGMSDKYQ